MKVKPLEKNALLPHNETKKEVKGTSHLLDASAAFIKDFDFLKQMLNYRIIGNSIH